MKSLLIFIFIVIYTETAMAQEKNERLQRMNVVKLELSQPLYPNSIVASYERVIAPYRTVCITVGYEELPQIIDFSSDIKVKDDRSKSGFKAGIEYRFYLKSENRYTAPQGTYIGPYFSFHGLYNNREIEVKSSGVSETVELGSDFEILNLGLQIGHQFVIGNRWTIDVVTIGPSVSNYRASLQFDGDFTFDKSKVQNEIFLKILDRFPMLEKVLTDKEVSTEGKFDSWSYGWRFQFHVGYYFGRKRK